MAARQLLNWSQMSLGASAGVNIRAVIALENSRREVPETAIGRINTALETDGVVKNGGQRG
jgi:transcriptional regulator with XRE-family HTH domain